LPGNRSRAVASTGASRVYAVRGLRSQRLVWGDVLRFPFATPQRG